MHTPNAEPSTLFEIARIVLGLDAAILSPAVLKQAKLVVLDTIGCGLAAAEDPIAAAARAIVARDPRPGCPLIGHRHRTDLLGAVIANGVAIRVADLNDYVVGEQKGQPDSAGHPSDNIPVALAVASARRKNGRDLLAAIVLGYEFFVRLQNLMHRGGAWDGVTVSGLVAAAIAGRLMGFDENRLAHAMALGLSRAATPALVRSGDISAAKSIANAMVAHSAVQAALLSEQGVSGPLAILDSDYGLAPLFAHGDLARLTDPVPDDGGAIMRAHVKVHPCVNTGQSAVAAALALHKRFGPGARTLSRIELIMADYPVIKRHQEDPARIHPTSRESADHSFPFLVAVTLIDGRFDVAQFAGERWRDPEVTALMERIVMRRDASLNARAPGAYPCFLHSWDNKGHETTIEILDPPGFSRGGLDETVVLEKFHAIAAPHFDDGLRMRIIDAVMELECTSSMAPLDSAIAIDRSSP